MGKAVSIRTGKSIEGDATDAEMDATVNALKAALAAIEASKG